jgi:hypothetical protein
MYKRKILSALSVPLVLALGMSTTQSTLAWGDWGWNGWHGGGYGFYAGQQDAIYDHDQGNAYQPYGQCLPCHSQGYWDNFHQGYDQQWNQYQGQDTTQGSSININGDNNYVVTNQYSNQQQNPLQQLAHTVCGFVNCNVRLKMVFVIHLFQSNVTCPTCPAFRANRPDDASDMSFNLGT